MGRWFQNNLGVVYSDRILGDESAENLEISNRCLTKKRCKFALVKHFPYRWADTQNNLGAAYDERVLGDRAENLEMSIDRLRKRCCEFALAKHFPVQLGNDSGQSRDCL